MAIRCDACAMPVHEQVVVCPHCGERTGVPVDPVAASEIATLPELPAESAAEHLVGRRGLVEPIIEPLGRAVATGVAKVVEAARGLVANDDADSGSLPRAIAREKPRHDTDSETTPTHRKHLE